MDRDVFSNEVLQCIEKGLNTHGPSIKQSVYWKLLTEYNLKLSEVVDHPREFVQALDSMFGAGAVLIERAISREMITHFQIDRPGSTRFEDVLRRASEACTSSSYSMVDL